MRTVLFTCIAVISSFFLPVAYAVEGNKDEGRAKAYTCTGCHGISGYRNAYPSYRVPKIHNQYYDYLVAALHAYRTGERQHPTMRAQGESLTDQDIADIARYLSETPSSTAAP